MEVLSAHYLTGERADTNETCWDAQEHSSDEHHVDWGWRLRQRSDTGVEIGHTRSLNRYKNPVEVGVFLQNTTQIRSPIFAYNVQTYLDIPCTCCRHGWRALCACSGYCELGKTYSYIPLRVLILHTAWHSNHWCQLPILYEGGVKGKPDSSRKMHSDLLFS